MFKFIYTVILMTLFVVGTAIPYTVGYMDFGISVNLFKLLATLYAGLAAFLLSVLLPIALLMKVLVKKLILIIVEPVYIASATTSLEAVSLKALEQTEKFGVSRK